MLDYATPPSPPPKGRGAARVALWLCVPFFAAAFLDLRPWAGEVPGAVVCAVACPATAVAVVLVTRRATAAGRDEAVGKRLRLALVVGLFQLAISLVFVLSHVRWSTLPKHDSTHHRCMANLRQIGRAMIAYMGPSGGGNPPRYPPTLDVLISNGSLAPETFVCPGSSDVAATGATTQQVVRSFLAGPGRCSYVYHCPSTPPVGRYSKYVLMHESLANHARAGGMNVMYADFSVEFAGAERARYILAELKAGHNPPREMQLE
jgi:hypothetical protein